MNVIKAVRLASKAFKEHAMDPPPAIELTTEQARALVQQYVDLHITNAGADVFAAGAATIYGVPIRWNPE